ncbi:hypothetical protein MBLNU230_g4898t1 [Neophaeotheca triangularis]
MSLKFGLNIKKKGPQATPARRPNILGDDDEYDGGQDDKAVGVEELSSFSTSGAPEPAPSSPPKRKVKTQTGPSGPLQPPSRRRPGEQEGKIDASTANAQRTAINEAEQLDALIFDYDSFHDAKSTVNEAKKEAQRQEAVERKPKYINNLLDAAAKRKQDQQIAREKLLQKERENEGDEFADKEKFVTGAYKEQQEETRKLEDEQKRKDEEADRKRRQMGGGMQSLYKGMMEQNERQHQEAMEAAKRVEEGGAASKNAKSEEDHSKTDAELAAEMRAKGIDVELNEEGQITDKRQLLSAGLNVAPSRKDSDLKAAQDRKDFTRQTHPGFQRRNNDQATRERQTKMMEEQLAASAKRAREEEEEERARAEKAAKSQKTNQDVSDAKARYLARKAAKERGEA